MCRVCGALERESASSSEQAATYVKLSGDTCIHTHEWQLLALNIVILLVSTYVVCERLSVMHEPAGVVENLVQNSESTLLSEQ